MKIWYAAHGTNMSVEEDGEDAYVWTSNYSSRLGGEGDYYAEKIISRVGSPAWRDTYAGGLRGQLLCRALSESSGLHRHGERQSLHPLLDQGEV